PQRGTPSSSCPSLPPVLPPVAHSPRPREGCARAARCRVTCARPHRRPPPPRRSPPPLRPQRGVVARRRAAQNLAITSRADRKRDPSSRNGSRHSTLSSYALLRLQRPPTSKAVHHWRQFVGRSAVGSSFGQRQPLAQSRRHR